MDFNDENINPKYIQNIWHKNFAKWRIFNASFEQHPSQSLKECDSLIYRMIENNIETLLSIGLLSAGFELRASYFYNQFDKNLKIVGIDPNPTKYVQEVKEFVESEYGFHFNVIKDKSENVVFENNDMVFIDGDHHYKCVKSDFEKAIKIANKMIAFHDITTTVKEGASANDPKIFWKEIKNSYKHEEFKHPEALKNLIYGIGVIYL